MTGNAAAASDDDYVVRVRNDADSNASYSFKVPYGSHDNSWAVGGVSSTTEGEEQLQNDPEDREVICSGTVGSDGLDEWTTRSTCKPFGDDVDNVTFEVFETS